MTPRKLDRLVEFDQRSRLYPIRTLLPDRSPRSYTWALGQPNLDQGQEGACVGFAWAQELAAKPVVIPGITNAYARALYKVAQTLDAWPGEDYEGTSVLAGAKALQLDKRMGEYRWAFTIGELLAAIAWHGPVVLGVSWREAMFDPDADGRLHPDGPIVGGHAILANGVSVKRRRVRLENSWGTDWGVDGHAEIDWDDLEKVLADNGEACVPVARLKVSREDPAVMEPK